MSSILKHFKTNTLGGILLNIALIIVILLIVVTLFFFAYMPSMTNHGETITVPNVEGKSLEEAEKFLADHDLRLDVSDSAYSSALDPLDVIKQYPHPGAKVKEGRKIYLTLNQVNPPSVPLPNLLDQSVIGAEALLKTHELKRGHIQMVPGPFNIVKEMRYKGLKIAANTRVPKGASIDLVVMTGGDMKGAMFSVIGMPFEEAEFTILGNSYNVTVELVGDTTGQHPVVIKQKPEPGEEIFVGEEVTIWIGKPGSELPVEDIEDPE